MLNLSYNIQYYYSEILRKSQSRYNSTRLQKTYIIKITHGLCTVPDPFPTPWTYQHHPDALSRETPSSRTIEPHARPAEPINSRTHETNIPWSYEPGTPHFSTEEPNTSEDFKEASPADIECCEIQSKTRRGTRRSRGQDTRRSSHSARSRKKMEGKIPCKIFTKKIIKDKALPYKILTRGENVLIKSEYI